MRGRLTVGLALLGALLAWSPEGQAARTVTDSAGRQVDVPDRIERVFPAGPPAMVFLYVLAPETLLGWTREFAATRRLTWPRRIATCRCSGVSPAAAATPTSRWVLATRPDLIFDFGSVAPTYASLADRVQAQTGVPYALIDGRFATTARCCA